MDVELTIVKELAAVPPNVTDDDPVKLVPVMGGSGNEIILPPPN
jgi:hypothetical protein